MKYLKNDKKWWVIGGILLVIVGLVVAIFWVCCYIKQNLEPSTVVMRGGGVMADEGRLREDVKRMSEDWAPRYHDSTENLRKCRQRIAQVFRECGAVVDEQEYDAHGHKGVNIRGLFGSRTKERVVVGAHYDAYRSSENWINYGADDNASGVAGLLELARMYREDHLDVPLELVAYDTEEPPFFRSHLMGSYVHARQLKEEGARVKGVLVLEMIGYFSDEPKSQSFPLPGLNRMYPETGNFIALVGTHEDRDWIVASKRVMMGGNDLPVYSMCVPKFAEMVHLSDHRSYWDFNYPSLMITDTANHRNRSYHQETDKWQILDYKRMAKVVEQVHQVIRKSGENHP